MSPNFEGIIYIFIQYKKCNLFFVYCFENIPCPMCLSHSEVEPQGKEHFWNYTDIYYKHHRFLFILEFNFE